MARLLFGVAKTIAPAESSQINNLSAPGSDKDSIPKWLKDKLPEAGENIEKLMEYIQWLNHGNQIIRALIDGK